MGPDNGHKYTKYPKKMSWEWIVPALDLASDLVPRAISAKDARSIQALMGTSFQINCLQVREVGGVATLRVAWSACTIVDYMHIRR